MREVVARFCHGVFSVAVVDDVERTGQ